MRSIKLGQTGLDVSLDIELTDDEVAALEAPYTPRDDVQGTSNDVDLARMSARASFNPADA
jgi:1-deoxyxylulose-5-phosphate synthase